MKKLTIFLCLFSSISLLLFGCQKQQPQKIPITDTPGTEYPDSEKNIEEESTEQITEIEQETKKNKKITDINVGDIIYGESDILITYNGITYDEFLGVTEEVLSFTVKNTSSDKKCVEFYAGRTTHIWEVESQQEVKTSVRTEDLNLSNLYVSISQKDSAQTGVGLGTAKKLMKINFVKQEAELKKLYENDDLLIEKIDVIQNASYAALFIKVSPKEHQTHIQISNLSLNDIPYEPSSITIPADESSSNGETTLIAYTDKVNSMKIPFYDGIKDGTTISGTLTFTINYKFTDVENDTEKVIDVLTVISKNFTD